MSRAFQSHTRSSAIHKARAHSPCEGHASCVLWVYFVFFPQASASTLAGEGCEPVTTTEARAGALFVTKYSDRRTPMLLRAVELFVLVLGAYYSVELMNNVPWYQMIFLGYPALTCCFTNWRGEEQEGAHITLSTAQVGCGCDCFQPEFQLATQE